MYSEVIQEQCVPVCLLQSYSE